MSATTWEKKLTPLLKSNGESWGDVIGCAIARLREGQDNYSDWIYETRERAYTEVYIEGGEAARAALSEQTFDDGFGGAEGAPFTMWTPNHVYFPTEYDGAEGVASTPRNPCSTVTRHT